MAGEAHPGLPVVNPGVEGQEVDVRRGVVCNSILPCGRDPALPPSYRHTHTHNQTVCEDGCRHIPIAYMPL